MRMSMLVMVKMVMTGALAYEFDIQQFLASNAIDWLKPSLEMIRSDQN